MNQVLSQVEVDALLNAAKTPDGGANVSADPSPEQSPASSAFNLNIAPYDLSNQDRVIRGRQCIEPIFPSCVLK